MAKKMWNHLEVSVPGTSDEYAVEHGLGVVPTFVILTDKTGPNIAIGETPPDATNIYLDNPGGAAEDAKVLVFTPHTVIDG